MSIGVSGVSSAGWQFFLGNSVDMSLIGELKGIQSVSMTPQLDAQGSASFTLNPKDPLAPYVQKVSTCLITKKDGTIRWSGPVVTKQTTLNDGQMSLQVGCAGWFWFINNWIVKCGPNVIYTPPSGTPAVDSSTQLTYPGIGTTGYIDQCTIIADLLERAFLDAVAHDAPYYIGLGNVPTNTQNRYNTVFQQFQNVGQAITQMAQLESGFDFSIDPTSRSFDMYYDGIWPVGGPYTVNGKGQVRSNLLWGYNVGPKNLQGITEQDNGNSITNDVFTTGQYGYGYGFDQGSMTEYGLFSESLPASNVTVPQILAAYAQVEAFTRADGIKIWSFDQMPYAPGSGVPRPWVDFDVGDFGYLVCDYGSLVIPEPGQGLTKQPVRVFAFTVTVNNEGVEQVKNIQTTYQQSA